MISLIPTQKNKLKHILLEYASMCLWEENEPKFFQYLFYYASELQIITIFLSAQYSFFSAPTEDTLTIFIKKCANILSLHEVLVEDTTYNAKRIIFLIILLYFFIGNIVFYLILSRKLVKSEITRTEHLIIVITSKFHFDVLFWPLNCFLLHFLACHHVSFNIAGEIGTSDTGFRILIIFLILMNYFVSFWAGLLNYDPVKTDNPFAMRRPTIHLLAILFKGLMAPVIFFTEDEITLRILVLVISIVIGYGRRGITISGVSYYHSEALKTVSIIPGCLMMFILCLIICMIRESWDKQSAMVLL